MKSFQEYSSEKDNGLEGSDSDSFTKTDFKYNLNRVSTGLGLGTFSKQFPNLSRDIVRLSPEAREELDEILRMLMTTSLSRNSRISRRFRR